MTRCYYRAYFTGENTEALSKGPGHEDISSGHQEACREVVALLQRRQVWQECTDLTGGVGCRPRAQHKHREGRVWLDFRMRVGCRSSSGGWSLMCQPAEAGVYWGLVEGGERGRASEQGPVVVEGALPQPPPRPHVS